MTEPQHIGVCAILVNVKGMVLAGKRKNSYKSGEYGLPGGRVEFGELLIDAVRREVKEETGLSFSPNDFQYVGVVREKQDGYDFIHFVYILERVTQIPQLCEPEKCEGWEWLSTNMQGVKLLRGHRAAIDLWRRGDPIADVQTSTP